MDHCTDRSRMHFLCPRDRLRRSCLKDSYDALYQPHLVTDPPSTGDGRISTIALGPGKQDAVHARGHHHGRLRWLAEAQKPHRRVQRGSVWTERTAGKRGIRGGIGDESTGVWGTQGASPTGPNGAMRPAVSIIRSRSPTFHRSYKPLPLPFPHPAILLIRTYPITSHLFSSLFQQTGQKNRR